MLFSRSTDHGLTFSKPIRVTPVRMALHPSPILPSGQETGFAP
jgi:hypothetical protein